ncbi:hypothetical protein WJ05_27885 [Burkholderia vietnamiensis]|nr:hypothetical protein WJ05_27885 [Burkholderia vietnamiensis]
MKWLEPWCSTEDADENFHHRFARQLQLEVGPGHELFGLPTRLIGRGNGDDALFEILDGTSRVAVVHLTWAKTAEQLPWPITNIYSNLQEWAVKCMQAEHEDWKE